MTERLPKMRRSPTRKPTPPQITDRDLEVMKTIWENRFLTLPLLIQLFPPDSTKAPPKFQGRESAGRGVNLSMRLQRLFHWHYIDRIRIPYANAPYVYALGSRGAKLLLESQPELPLSDRINWEEKNRGLSGIFINHELMIARFRTALTVALRKTPRLEFLPDENGILFHREPRKLQWRTEGKLISVNPDAHFIIKDSQAKTAYPYFLEADRSTMPIERAKGRDIIQKLEHYSMMYTSRKHIEQYEIPNFRLLFLTKSADRIDNIMDVIGAPDSSIPKRNRHFFFFATDADYEQPTNVLAAIWRSADNPCRIKPKEKTRPQHLTPAAKARKYTAPLATKDDFCGIVPAVTLRKAVAS